MEGMREVKTEISVTEEERAMLGRWIDAGSPLK